MKLSLTYLKNDGLYQAKLNRLIYENNAIIRTALEVYNLYHGCDPNKIHLLKYSPLFQDYYQALGELVPEVKNLLGRYCDTELEYMMDVTIDYCWKHRFDIPSEIPSTCPVNYYPYPPVFVGD